MKNKIACMIVNVMLLSAAGFAQVDKSGIYLNVADYRNQKLTYEIDCRNDKHKIRLNEFFNKPYITVVHDRKKYTHQKKDIYGFRDCDNNLYRFFGNDEYKVEESKEIIIYSKNRNETQSKGFTVVKDYYFSQSPNAEIRRITIGNLKIAFPNNHKFHDMLDENFKNGDASMYDDFHKMFKVNHLLEMSLKQ